MKGKSFTDPVPSPLTETTNRKLYQYLIVLIVWPHSKWCLPSWSYSKIVPNKSSQSWRSKLKPRDVWSSVSKCQLWLTLRTFFSWMLLSIFKEKTKRYSISWVYSRLLTRRSLRTRSRASKGWWMRKNWRLRRLSGRNNTCRFARSNLKTQTTNMKS